MQRVLDALEHHKSMVDRIQANVDQRFNKRERNKMGWYIGSVASAGILMLTPAAPFAFAPCGVAGARLFISRRDKKHYRETSYLINKPTLVEVVDGVLNIGFEQTFVDENPGKKIKKETVRVEKTILRYDGDVSHLTSSLEKAIECTHYEHNLLKWNKRYLEREIDEIKETKKAQPDKSKWERRKMLIYQGIQVADPRDHYLSHIEIMATSISRRRVVQHAIIEGRKQLEGYEAQEDLDLAKELQQELDGLYDKTLTLAEQTYPLIERKIKVLLE